MDISKTHMLTRQVKTTKDYCNAGLVGLWDGIENYDIGQHREKLEVWKDLSGHGRDVVLMPNASAASTTMTFFNDTNETQKYTIAESLGSDYAHHRYITTEFCGRVSKALMHKDMRTYFATGRTTQDSLYTAFDSEFGMHLGRTSNYGWQSGLPNDKTMTLTVTASADKSSDISYNIAKFYVNGQLVKQEDPSNWIFTSYEMNTMLLLIIAAKNSLVLNCVRMYVTDNPLSDSDVVRNFEVDKVRFGL